MKRLIIVFLLLIIFPAIASGTKVSIRSNYRDAKISSRNDTLNYGTAKVMTVGIDSTGTGVDDTTRYLIQTDIINTLIPKEAIIDSVFFKVYSCSTSSDTILGSGTIYLYELDSTFTEGDSNAAKDTTNWRFKTKAIGSGVPAWKTRGGDYRNVKLDTANFTNATDSLFFRGDSTKAMVQRWVSGTSTNKGLILKLSTEAAARKKFVFISSDSSGYEGRWEIWYRIPARNYYRFNVQDSTGNTFWKVDSNLTIGNSDSVSHKSLSQLKVMMSDSAKDVVSDSLALALLKSKFGDSLKTNTVWKDSARKFISDSLNLAMRASSLDDSLHNADSVRTRSLVVTGNEWATKYWLGTDTLASALKLRTDIKDTVAQYTTNGLLDTTKISGTQWAQYVKNNQNVTAGASTGNPDSLKSHDGNEYALKVAVSDSIKRNRYLMIPFEKFIVDTNKTIGTSDTINFYTDFRGDTTIQIIATDDSSYGRLQNLAIRASIYLDSNVVSVDTIVFWFRTKFTVRDSNKVCFYAGEQSRWTWSIAYTDSLVDTCKVSWTKISLKPTGLVGGDILALMIRGYCKGRNYNYFGNCYAVLRRK